MQKTIIMRIEKEKLESRRQLEEHMKIERLKKKTAKERAWKLRRENMVEVMDTQDNFQVKRLEEIMKCWDLFLGLEDASGEWRHWSVNDHPLSHADSLEDDDMETQEIPVCMVDMEWQCCGLETLRRLDSDIDHVEVGMELIEHD